MQRVVKQQRVGLLVPSSNSTQEPEFSATLPSSVSLHVTRLGLASVDPDSTLKIVAELEKEAKKLADADVDVILLAATAPSTRMGKGYDAQLIQRIYDATGRRATTAATAMIAAMGAYKARRVALAGPWSSQTNQQVTDFLASHGIEVLSQVAGEVTRNNDIGRMPPESAIELGLKADRADADVLFLACGNWWTMPIIEALEAGLAVYQGKPLVNSVTGEAEVMDRVLPLVAKYGAAVVAISNDETGISEDPNVRFEVAKRIVQRAADYGIPAHDVVVDPLVMPIGAMGTAGRQVFALLRRLVEELGVNTTCGASNVSFGLPNRNAITGTFLSMAMSNGMSSAIMNPMHPEVKSAIMAADVLMGNDRDCYAWIKANRDPNAAGGAREGRAEGGRRRNRG